MKKSKRICGIDEAGRGALAGPLVAAAVILRKSHNIKLRDSKLLLPKQRRKIVSVLKKQKAELYIEVITSRQINNHGIGWANKEVMRKLIRNIDADKYIVDGNLKLGKIQDKTSKIRSVVNADATVPAVIAAGIVAKVYRDKLMAALHKQFPYYHWRQNAGYGTQGHIEAIRMFNVTYYHRSIFVTTALKEKVIRRGRVQGS